MNINTILQNLGFKQYEHTSGAIAWSISNLAEYSDEWTAVTSSIVK